MRVFLDACIYIYGVEDNEAAGQAVRRLLSELPHETEFVTTDLIRFEVLSGASVRANSDLRDEYDAILAICRNLPVTRELVNRAIDFRADYGLRALDALHLAAAVGHGSDEFWTNDRKMLALTTIERTKVRRIP